MARIFYCGGLLGQLGMLRAVIPVENLAGVLSSQKWKYVGQSFPKLGRVGPECIVIEVIPGEEQDDWKTGFYLVSRGPIEFENQLSRQVPVPPN